MAERMTTITLPGLHQGGMQEYGRQLPSDMIAAYRRRAQQQLFDAAAVLAAADSDFRVVTHTGVHAQRNREVLQEGRA